MSNKADCRASPATQGLLTIHNSKASEIISGAETKTDLSVQCDLCDFNCENENIMIAHMSDKHETCYQSCKNLGSVVPLLQGNFEKSHHFKANFEKKNTQF